MSTDDKDKLKANIAEAQARYGDHRWWQSSDPREFAYYQLHERIFLGTDFSQFHNAVEQLLGRPVQTYANL